MSNGHTAGYGRVVTLSRIRDTLTSPPLRPATAYVLFTASGACGLTYQVLWARWLALVLGNTVASVSIVLSSFMLGLALGSWAAGRTLSRVRRPLRIYALLEVAIGLFAFAFPLLTSAAERALGAVIDTDSPRPVALAAKAAVAFALLLVPTTLMGATLPQLTTLLKRLSLPGRRWRLGLLYAVNTAGAALGSVLVGFAGIELLGIRQTTLLAALLNLLVGLVALRVDKRLAELPESDAARTGAAPASGVGAALPLLALTASGAAALAGEVLWTRWLEVLVGNSSYAFALMLAVYLTGIAAGSALPSLVMDRLRHLAAWLVATQLGAAGWLLLAVPAFNGLAARFSQHETVPLTMASLLAVYALAAALLLPSALLSGAVFPLATRLLAPAGEEASGEQAARAYAWNTLGAVLGALVGGWLIAPRFDFLEAMLVLAAGYAAIAAVAAALVALSGAGSPLATTRPLAAALLLAALPLGGWALWRERREGGYDQHIRRAHADMRVLFHERGPQGITTVLSPPDGDRFHAVLAVNAVGMTRLVTATKLMAHLPLIAHPDPQETLVICFGMGTTFRSAMSHGHRVTVVELVGQVPDAFPTFHPDTAALRRDPRGRVVIDDGRSFLQLTRQRFDVITIDPPPPIDSAGVNNLYSRDFTRLARSRLKPGGIFAQWIPYPRGGSGVADRRTFSMLLRSITDAFPYVAGVGGLQPIGMHILASEHPIALDQARLRARLQDSRVLHDVDEWEHVPLGWFLALRPIDPRSVEAFPPVTDDRPRLEFDLIRLWRAGVPKPFHRVLW
ncbi:MAG TPA: hypothetical protein VGV61_10245 [Thermoanaerobaculia bacterium]|nr:hypothetical protein [Thermoanaerobaculia bacterium]